MLPEKGRHTITPGFASAILPTHPRMELAPMAYFAAGRHVQAGMAQKHRLGPLLSALTDVGYDGAVCIEVEDRADEGSLESRKDVPPPAVHVLIDPAPAGPPWTLYDGPRESWAVVWCIQLTPA